MISGSLLPEKPWVRVRPWTVIILRAGLDQRARELGRVAVVLVPAGAVLDRDRHVRGHRGDDRAHELLRDRRLAHQRRAALAGDDALGRAAHVDVDQRGADRDRHLRGGVHHRAASRPKICTPNRRPSSDAVSLPVVFGSPADSACAERNSVIVQPDAELLAHGAERQIGDRRHRREQHRRFDRKVTDAHDGNLYRIERGLKTRFRSSRVGR